MLLNQEENYTKMIAIKNNFYIIKNNSKNTNNKLYLIIYLKHLLLLLYLNLYLYLLYNQ